MYSRPIYTIQNISTGEARAYIIFSQLMYYHIEMIRNIFCPSSVSNVFCSQYLFPSNDKLTKTSPSSNHMEHGCVQPSLSLRWRVAMDEYTRLMPYFIRSIVAQSLVIVNMQGFYNRSPPPTLVMVVQCAYCATFLSQSGVR